MSATALTHTQQREGAAARDAEQRMRIVQTAEGLFRDFGLHKTTVADIARALRMSPANVYRFFASKAEIQEAVAAHVVGELERAARGVADAPGRAGDKLRVLVKMMQAVNAERLTRNSRLHEMVDVALAERWPIIGEHIRRIREIYAGVIADGVAAGDLVVDDPFVAAGLFQSATVAYVHPRLMVECADLDMPPVDAMIDLVLRGWRKA